MSPPHLPPVLLTGASGFLGGHILAQLLEKGYPVRCAVRNNSSVKKIQSKLMNHHYDELLSFVLITDMAAPCAFDEAVADVSDVMHCASPFSFDVQNIERELLQPCIGMTLSLLRSVAAYRSSHQTRVIMTSSFAAVLDLDQGARPSHIYTENDWNPATYQEASAHSSIPWAYCASKALAEKAAWGFVESLGPRPGLSLTTCCPPWIIGPHVLSVDIQNMNESSQMLYNLINGSLSTVPPTDFGGFCDVRDVATAHVYALESPAARGKRFILSAGSWRYQHAIDAIIEAFPELARTGKVPLGSPGSGHREEFYMIDSTKATDVLGLQFRSLRTSVTEAIQQMLDAENTLETGRKD